MIVQRYRSKEDASVNFTIGSLEARFVQRDPEYFIIYLSSQRGCNQACRFCHLTQTGQTEMIDATKEELIQQVSIVLNYYISEVRPNNPGLKKVHVNFMARGEFLLNDSILGGRDNLLLEIRELIRDTLRIEEVRFNISTIMPKAAFGVAHRDTITQEILPQVENTWIYYSMYSVDPKVRKRWIPKAMNVQDALDLLRRWQGHTKNNLVIHHAYIQGVNDSIWDVWDTLAAIELSEVRAKFNLVRYNPYSEDQGEESPDRVLLRNFDLMNSQMKLSGSRIVPRVGRDVAASCGVFLNL